MNDQQKRRCSPALKPLEARNYAEAAQRLLSEGQPLPPLLRAWLVNAFRDRLSDPHASLDRLLGLKSRKGGRLHAFAKQPARDKAIRDLGNTLSGPVTERARALAGLIAQHRQTPDPRLVAIERTCGRVPSSVPQLVRILGGRAGTGGAVRSDDAKHQQATQWWGGGV